MNGEGWHKRQLSACRQEEVEGFYSIVFPFSKFHFPFAVSATTPSPPPPLSFLSENRSSFKSPLIANLSFLLKSASAAAARKAGNLLAADLRANIKGTVAF